MRRTLRPPSSCTTRWRRPTLPAGRRPTGCRRSATGPGSSRGSCTSSDVPATIVATPSVFTIETSPRPLTLVVSTATLSALFGSVTPTGTSTVAVLVTTPSWLDAIVASIVNVADPPSARSTAVGDVAGAARQRSRTSQARPCSSRWHRQPAGHRVVHGSAEDCRRAVVGDNDVVGHGVAGQRGHEAVGLGDRQVGDGVRASLSLAVSFAGFVSTTPTGSVTVALLTTKPAAAGSTSATTRIGHDTAHRHRGEQRNVTRSVGA